MGPSIGQRQGGVCIGAKKVVGGGREGVGGRVGGWIRQNNGTSLAGLLGGARIMRHGKDDDNERTRPARVCLGVWTCFIIYLLANYGAMVRTRVRTRVPGTYWSTHTRTVLRVRTSGESHHHLPTCYIVIVTSWENAVHSIAI